MNSSKEEWLTQQEVADELRVKYETIKDWTNSGKLPSVKLAWNVVRISRADLNEFMENNKQVVEGGLK